MDIECRSSVVRPRVKLIGGKVCRPRRVGLGKVQHIKPEERKLTLANTEVGDQLILVVNTAGLKLIRILVYTVRSNAGSRRDVIRARQEGVDVVAIELMQTS